jgi:hypothetical protein
MKTKLVYIMEREDIEVLRKAKSIINLLYNAEVEFEDDAVEQDLLSEFGDIEDMCIEGVVNDEWLDEMCKDFDDEEDEGDEEDEPIVDFCEYCGCVIEEDDTHWVAANGAICCCDECVVAYNRELGEYDDEEEEDE